MKTSGSVSLTGFDPKHSCQIPSNTYSHGAERVGYAPGQVGYVPPDMAQWNFQNHQFERMYAPKDRWIMGHRPILMATAWSFPLAFLAAGVFLMAYRMTPDYWNATFEDIVVVAILWSLVFTVCIYFPYRLWLLALVLHRRKHGDRGRFSRKLWWLDPLLADPRNQRMLDRDYPLDPNITGRDFYPYV